MTGQQRQVVLTERDIELFRWLWMLRALTLGQLRRLGYYQPDTGQISVLDNVRKRLKRLWDTGYLEGRRLFTTKERVYLLGEPALPALRERFGINQRRLFRPKLESDLQLLHPLMVSECAVRMVESVRENEFELAPMLPLGIPFVHTRTVGDATKRRHTDRFVAHEDIVVPGEEQARIRPDLVCGLEKQGRSRLYLWEADRDTKSPQEVLAKQLAYAQYWNALDPEEPHKRLWQRYGPFQDFRVLIVTTSQRRLENLASALAGHDGWELVALTTLEQLEHRDPLFAPIWRNHQGKERTLARAGAKATS